MIFKTSQSIQKSCLIVAYPRIDTSNASSLAPLSLNPVPLSELAIRVTAAGVDPELVVDKKAKLDGSIEYSFAAHSYGVSPQLNRTVLLLNQEKIILEARAEIDGPFKISNSEPLESIIGKDTYLINPNSSIKLHIKYKPPHPNDEKEWPPTLVNEKTGTLKIFLNSGKMQEFKLRATLRKPRLFYSTTGNDSLSSLNLIDFGTCSVESYRIKPIHLMNETEVEAHWVVQYVKHIPKKVIGYKTITIEEKEDLDKTDDPEVFLFSVSEVVL